MTEGVSRPRSKIEARSGPQGRETDGAASALDAWLGTTLAWRLDVGMNPVTLVAPTLAGEAITRAGSHMLKGPPMDG